MDQQFNIRDQIKNYLTGLINLRRKLHGNPDLSGEEGGTVQIISDFMALYKPDEIISDIGGHGLAFVYHSEKSGPAIMMRCELDALPIKESNEFRHKSLSPKVSHKCGHDGHMAIVAGLGVLLSQKRPLSGTVVLLFQPAEETGKGAALVISDPKFKKIKPDYVFALHNLPGYSLGKVFIRSGEFASASKGMIIKLFGKTSHAAHPEDGINPTIPMCSIIEGLHALSATLEFNNIFSFVTVVYACLGESAFGTAPGYAEIMATLRADTDQNMNFLAEYAIQLVDKYTKAAGLSCEISWQDEFAPTSNDTKAYEIVKRAAFSEGIEVVDLQEPFRWSEDFGEFTNRFQGAMIGIGAGEDCPQLHSPDYDFPDMIIPQGIRLFWGMLYALLK